MAGDKVTRKELEERLAEIEAKVDDIKVLAANLEGGKRKVLDARVSRIEQGLAPISVLPKSVDELQKHAVLLEQKLANAFATIKELVASLNSANVFLGSIERFLDEKFGENWDDGIRKEVEARANLLKRRKELQSNAVKSKEISNEERNELAAEIWKLAQELDTRSNDVAMVISLYLQSREVNAALNVVEELSRDDVTLSEQVAKLVQTLVDRCAAIAKEQENELTEARVERIPTLVDPSGNPISSA